MQNKRQKNAHSTTTKVQVPNGVFSGLLAYYCSFWDLANNPFRGFFLNFAEMC
jgi:hypothetical protein